MKVLIVNDLCVGGAATACFRLVDALNEFIPDQVFVATGYRCTSHPTSYIGWSHGIYSLAKYIPKFAGDSLKRKGLNNAFRLLLQEVKPDVINFHNLHDAPYWSLDMVEIALEHAPVVWTLHDIWPLTGGRDYILPTEHKIEAIQKSEQTLIYHNKEKNRMRSIIQKAGARLAAVAPSLWLRDTAQGLFVTETVHLIPNSVPLDLFTPEGREAAQKHNCLQEDSTIGLVVAVKLSDPRKGGEMLLQALNLVREPLTVIYVGREPPAVTPENFSYRSFGRIDDSRKLAEIYRAADFLVHPAIIDNLPNVVVESLACGTPVVAFECGGLPDMVLPGRTGWLANEMTPDSLAEALDSAVKMGTRDGMRARCREFAENNFEPKRQAKQYLDLFEEMVSQNS